jgi:methyl-accepting chemotaxis protein
MRNITIKQRLIFGFGALIALFVALAVLAYSRVETLASEIELVGRDRYPKTVTVNGIKNGLNEQARKMRNLFILETESQRKMEFSSISASDKIMDEGFNNLKESIHSEKGKALLTEVLNNKIGYLDSRNKFYLLFQEIQKKQSRYFG